MWLRVAAIGPDDAFRHHEELVGVEGDWDKSAELVYFRDRQTNALWFSGTLFVPSVQTYLVFRQVRLKIPED